MSNLVTCNMVQDFIRLNIQYSMANRSLYRHAHNWVPTQLALQDTGTQHTTWRYNDLLVVLPVYHYPEFFSCLELGQTLEFLVTLADMPVLVQPPITDLGELERKLTFNSKFEPCCEKTGLLGFGPGPTQTRLYS